MAEAPTSTAEDVAALAERVDTLEAIVVEGLDERLAVLKRINRRSRISLVVDGAVRRAARHGRLLGGAAPMIIAARILAPGHLYTAHAGAPAADERAETRRLIDMTSYPPGHPPGAVVRGDASIDKVAMRRATGVNAAGPGGAVDDGANGASAGRLGLPGAAHPGDIAAVDARGTRSPARDGSGARAVAPVVHVALHAAKAMRGEVGRVRKVVEGLRQEIGKSRHA